MNTTTRTNAHAHRLAPMPLRSAGLHAITDSFQGGASNGPSHVERFCKACGTTKPASEFYSGRLNHCKTCFSAQVKAHQRVKPPVHFVMGRSPIKNSTVREIYSGAELQPFNGRPGANDALACPSRVGPRLFYRDGRVEVVA